MGVEVSIGGVVLWSGAVTGKEKPEVEKARLVEIGERILAPQHRVYEDANSDASPDVTFDGVRY